MGRTKMQVSSIAGWIDWDEVVLFAAAKVMKRNTYLRQVSSVLV